MSNEIKPHVCGPECEMSIWKWIKLYFFIAQWNVRDLIAGMLQGLARWIAP